MDHDASARRSAQQQYVLARAWHSKGRLAAAIERYREVLSLEPGHLGAAILLGAVMESQVRLDEALQIYRQALEHNPNDARIHKQFVNVLLAQEGPDAVFRHYRLARGDTRYLNLRPAEIVCCTAVRNELLRLPYFLEYYRAKGIGAFFAVDNASSDGTCEYLLEQRDVYLWRSDLAFHRANFGAGWFEPILRLYAQDHWCLIVDADELLYYPECEHRGIDELCRSLDAKGKRAFRAIVLDMYSERPIRQAHYASGESFEEVCPYFDRQFYHECADNKGPFNNQKSFYGGLRQRVFGEDRCFLSKVPLLKYGENCILAGGQHGTNLPPEQVASESGGVLHFKYFSGFGDRVSEDAARKEHYANAVRHQLYAECLQKQPGLTLYDPAHSIKLEGSRQLVGLGVMQADESADAATRVAFPKLDQVPPGVRPFWSVMLTVYRRTCYLEQALRSVLAQAPGPEEMQIEVVMDGSDDPTQTEVEAMVRGIAGSRIILYRHPSRAGHPEIFNICLRRARGLWVHLLHDDDWLAPGFYHALCKGIHEAPQIGAAFCRQTYVDELGKSLGLSLLERENPGLIDGWLDRIGAGCRLQTPSIVVRREVYERLGGYCPQARSVFDWEMWLRIAVHYPVWFEPQPLAFFRKSSGSEGARVAVSGEQVADTRAVIQIARSYLPGEKAEVLSRRASEHYALFALDLAREQIQSGNLRAAMANLQESLQCSCSADVRHQLLSLLCQAQLLQA
jgi:glycosyltransferase involved in cell wall biosynthesis